MIFLQFSFVNILSFHFLLWSNCHFATSPQLSSHPSYVAPSTFLYSLSTMCNFFLFHLYLYFFIIIFFVVVVVVVVFYIFFYIRHVLSSCLIIFRFPLTPTFSFFSSRCIFLCDSFTFSFCVSV